ncbi:MAG TPA: phage tail protein [Trichocoleus sp.]
MPTPTFPSQFEPVIGTEIQERFRVHEVRFGDGYRHTSPAGLNTKERTLNVSFSGLSEANKNTLINFLNSLNSTSSFFFTLPGEAIASLYKCQSYRYTTLGGKRWTVSAEFVLVYN